MNWFRRKRTPAYETESGGWRAMKWVWSFSKLCASSSQALLIKKRNRSPGKTNHRTLGLLWNAGETRVKCRNEFHRNADVIRPLVSQESFRRKRWRKEMCLTVHTGNQKSASTSWNRGQDSRGIEVHPFLRLSYDRRFPTFFLCLPREPKRA